MAIKKRNIPLQRYSDYRSYKQNLRIEFDHSCVYCSVREPEIGGSKSFHIDHYQPQNKFPEKRNDYSNLLYECRDCNAYKGAFWPTSLQKLLRHFILNPCMHDIDKHFECSDSIWKAKSKTGLWNLEKLRLNSQGRQRIRNERQLLKQTILKFEQQRRELEETFRKAQETNRNSIAEKYQIPQRIIEITTLIDVLKRKIEGHLD